MPIQMHETNDGGSATPMDHAMNNSRGNEFLKKMFFEAMKLSCSNKFLNYGELLEDESLYNNSINPINLILIEAIPKKQSPDDTNLFCQFFRHDFSVI